MRHGWTSVFAAVVAGVVMATAALAQTPTPGASPSETSKPSTPAASQVTPPSTSSASPGAPSVGAKAPKAVAGAKGKGGGMAPAAVKAAQQALKDKGHDPGPVDGRMGPKTSAALKAFQKGEGLPETGRLDSATRGKLGV